MTIRRLLIAGAALASLCAAIAAPAADAQSNQSRPISLRIQGSATISSPQTFSTTSYAALTGSSVTVTPIVDPNMTAAPIGQALGTMGYPQVHEHVFWSADVTKATATSGNCAIFINGAVLASSARTGTFASGESTIAGMADVVNTTTGAQTVQLQCKSADTNGFTVNNASLYVEEAF